MSSMEIILLFLGGIGVIYLIVFVTYNASFRKGLQHGKLEENSRLTPILQRKDDELKKKDMDLNVEREKVITLSQRLDNSIKYFSKGQKQIQQLDQQIQQLTSQNQILREQLIGYDFLKSDFEILKRKLERERDRSNHLAMMNITEEFRIAREAVYDDDIPFVFISGGAGTGKSQFVKYVLDQNADDILFVAPTGIAARNINGFTIHSCFHFKTAPYANDKSLSKNEYVNKRFDFLRRIKILVIDEISMVRSDLLDLICAALMLSRNDERPFGGVKIVAVGDLYQLPPVVDERRNPGLKERFSERKNPSAWISWSSPWFFSAHCMKYVPIRYIEFTHQFRQGSSEREYADMINRLRIDCDRDVLEYFNRRVKSAGSDIPSVFPTNNAVDSCNQKMLKSLSSNSVIFKGDCSGTFKKMNDSDLPVPSKLELKVGAKVMFVKNGSHWKNGSMGIVKALTATSVTVKSEDDGEPYEVQTDIWEDYQFDDRGELYIAGVYKQIPLVPAWAFTVHKTQGLTFKTLSYDPDRTFDVGMAYVALSRTTKIDGLYLEKPLRTEHVKHDGLVRDFYCNLSRGNHGTPQTR